MEKNILHVKCFKCDTCHLQLRKTNYQVFTEPITGKTSFHCRYHKLNKEEKVKENIEFFFLNLYCFMYRKMRIIIIIIDQDLVSIELFYLL